LSSNISGATVEAIVEFPEKGVYPFADTVYDMIKKGFINASSVGFKPLKYNFKDDGYGMAFIEQELLEFSFVPVPDNPEALITSKSVEKEQIELLKKEIEFLKEQIKELKTLYESEQQDKAYKIKDVLTDIIKQVFKETNKK